MECLNLQPINDDYTLALVTYANAMYDPKSDKTAELYEMLNKHALSGEYQQNHPTQGYLFGISPTIII